MKLNLQVLFPWLLCLVLGASLLYCKRPGMAKKQHISGSFIMQKPDTVKIIDTFETVKKVTVFKSLPPEKKVEVYQEAVQVRETKKTFKDKNQEIKVRTITTGTLDSLSIDYKIKESPRLYLGAETNIHGGRVSPQIKGILTTKKWSGSVGYDFTNKNVNVGIAFRIF